MKTNVNALKDLFVKFGGSLSTVYEDISPDPVGEYISISAMIDACAKVSGGGDSSLPAVTADDNGDVLTVVEGEWNKAEAPSGESNVEAITLTLDGTTISTELTSGEILDLAESGKVLVCLLDMSAAGQGYQQMFVTACGRFTDNNTLHVLVESETPTILWLTAATDSDPFTMTIGG